MRCVFTLASLFLLAWLPAAGQQDAPPTRPAGTGVTAPVLLPSKLTVSTPKHCDAFDGIVKFAGIIDAVGVPHTLKALDASDSRLIDFATQVVTDQRFKPATLNGSPTTVNVELTIGLHTCAEHENHLTDNTFYRFTLRAHPLIALAVVPAPKAQETAPSARTVAIAAEQVGGDIGAPIPTILTDPKIPISRKLSKRGLCLLHITVDANGVPRDIFVVRSLEPELDRNTIEAVKNWRFKPALRDGRVPVAVEGTVASTFEYVEKEPVAFATFIPEAPEKIAAALAHHDGLRVDLEPVNADEVIARYLPESRIPGTCLVSMLVDTKGLPQNVHIIKGLDSSLDMDTVAMIRHFRFKPVLQDGKTPVAVGVIMPVHYRMTVGRPTWKDLFMTGLNIAILI